MAAAPVEDAPAPEMDNMGVDETALALDEDASTDPDVDIANDETEDEDSNAEGMF